MLSPGIVREARRGGQSSAVACGAGDRSARHLVPCPKLADGFRRQERRCARRARARCRATMPAARAEALPFARPMSWPRASSTNFGCRTLESPALREATFGRGTMSQNQPPETAAALPLPNGKLTWRRAGKVAWLTLTNPPANGYSYEMMRDLDEAILRARFDVEVEVIVIAGEGDRFFCAGADISMLGAVGPDYKYAFCLHANETLRRLEETPKLAIAALGGHCVGGGLEVALACDLRVARRGSGKCGLPEVSLGVLPGTGGTQRLARVVGSARAIELMASGRLMEYEEA